MKKTSLMPGINLSAEAKRQQKGSTSAKEFEPAVVKR
jgi:hypothetical protein